MNQTEYITAVDNARNEIFNTPYEDMKSFGLFGLYSLMSACILRYLPHFKNEEHYRLIQEIQFNRNFALIDQFHFDLLNELQISDPGKLLEKSCAESQIFVTYHTGSYRMFIALLVQKKVPFCMVTDETFIEEQQGIVNELHRRISEHLNQDYDKELEIIKAQDPKLIFKLIDRLKAGVSVVFYIDGNTGVTSDLKANSNLLKIKFLDYFILARQGIALLAYLSKRPLVSALATRHPGLANSMDIKLIDDVLYTQMNRKEYVALITEKLYAELEQFLRKHPEQWEGWFYINRFKPEEETATQKQVLTKDSEIVVSLDEFAEVFHMGEHSFLIAKRKFTFQKISKALDDMLNFFREPKSIVVGQDIKVNNYDVSYAAIEELLEMGILVA